MSLRLPDEKEIRQRVYELKLYQNMQPIALMMTLNHEAIFLSYQFGAYFHKISMDSKGYFMEEVSRQAKVLTINNSKPTVFTNAPPPDANTGEKLNHVVTHFVAGAGNGFLGMGITKEERFPDAYIEISAYKNLYFEFSVIQKQLFSPIMTSIMNSRNLDIRESLSSYSRWIR